ncbi:MAG: biopolymer transporter ExbD [Marinilabiliaceae bacterium]|nr:biopolymer transporter ExbD [Marinilabiliaceae bacterium]
MASKKRVPEIPSASLADIAFLMLIFFLIATTMDTDKGIARMLPPIIEDQQDDQIVVKARNVFPVFINFRNEVSVKGPIHLSQLKELTKEFLTNPYNSEELPELVDTEVEYFGVIPITKHAVISLQTDRGTQYQTYLTVQNELQAAINELRNEAARKKFKKSYEDLDEDQQKAIRVIYPQRISEAEPRNIKK